MLTVLPAYTPLSDAHHYHTLATAVAEGRGLVHPFPLGHEHPTAFRPPLYPLLLGALYAVTGVRLGAAQMLNVVLGTLVAVLAASLAGRLAGRRAGIAAGLLTAGFPTLIANDGPPLSEPLGLALMLATLVLLLDRRTGWAGISTGLLMLTRPSAQLLLVALGAWIAWRLGWREAVRYAVVAVAVVMPWIARNWAAVGGPVLVTSNGFNLAATYSREALVVGDLVDPVFDAPFAPLRVGVADEATLDAAFRDYALASLRERPLGVIQVTARNALRLFEIKPSENIGAEFIDVRSIKAHTLTLPHVQLELAGRSYAL